MLFRQSGDWKRLEHFSMASASSLAVKLGWDKLLVLEFESNRSNNMYKSRTINMHLVN